MNATERRYNAENACLWCGAVTEKLYCSTQCGNKARMARFKDRKRAAIIKRHIEAMNAELRENRMEPYDRT